ncbi:Cytochrome [Frankia sp. AiPs1]|uniref:cytochrome P450 n=1 Tax=Frankia sp. AiPa1 TaxID=573492 RepID=UPI002551EE0D|nr:cytochrome P450 [Frankia sp. AiPa1]
MPDAWISGDFDHLSPRLAPVLHETLARMRSVCPVAHSGQHGGFWVVSRYSDVLRVAQDWETFTSTQGLNIPPTRSHIRNIPVEVDPPEQRVYKRLINTHFTPQAIAGWQPLVRAQVTRLIDAFLERGSCEFMNDFARPLPSLTFFELALAAPVEDLDEVARLASTSSIPNDPEAGAAWAGLAAWITDFVARRRGQPPRGDVVDAVLTSTFEGRPLTEQEIIGIVQLLILGGLETTAGALGLIMHRFCRSPEIPARLRARPDLIPKAVEELLRLDSPFIAIGRTATRDVELGGNQIRAGDKVLLYWASAGRDEQEFDAPDDFDPERAKNRHLAFGAGPHRCIGSNVARQNMRIALEELVRRLDDVRLADDADIHFHNTLTRAPRTLPITFTPARD